MEKEIKSEDVLELIQEYSSKFDKLKKETAVILAAGHGKRIKSHKSKMLHKIWGVPTVVRVYEACERGLGETNIITVVGIKAADVIKNIGRRKNGIFAYQEEQHGTGHAAQIALEKIDNEYDGTVYIFPGDMGLINRITVDMFKNEFKNSGADMMVLTGLYEGDYKENYYGRIVRVKDSDVNGEPSREKGQVIKIMEHKDILNLPSGEPHIVEFKGKKYSYTKEELLRNNEFNSGVFAYKYKYLAELIGKIESNNVQQEIYLTDLIDLFNKKNLKVDAISPKQQHVIMGFNNKSVLKEMEKIARGHVYDKLKDVIEIEDEEDFFIHESVVDDILKMDKEGTPLDIHIGKGAYIGQGVRLNYMNNIAREAFLQGNIVLGKNIYIGEGVELTCYPHQKLLLKDNVTILRGDIIKGNTEIGKNTRIESSVNITGSDEYPVIIGDNVTVKGTSYIFGSKIDNNLLIYHSILVRKKLKNPNKDGKQHTVSFYLPEAVGTEVIEDLD